MASFVGVLRKLMWLGLSKKIALRRPRRCEGWAESVTVSTGISSMFPSMFSRIRRLEITLSPFEATINYWVVECFKRFQKEWDWEGRGIAEARMHTHTHTHTHPHRHTHNNHTHTSGSLPLYER